jgi:hypothetical protein
LVSRPKTCLPLVQHQTQQFEPLPHLLRARHS